MGLFAVQHTAQITDTRHARTPRFASRRNASRLSPKHAKRSGGFFAMSNMRRPRWIWPSLVAVCALLAVIVVVAFRNRDQIHHPETGFPFPSPSDIVRMEAVKIVDHETGDVRSFDVPNNCWSEVLAAPSSSEQDPRPQKMEVLGHLIIATGKESTFVQLYRQPGSVGEFSIGNDSRSAHHKYFRGGNSKQLERALNRACVESRQSDPETH